MQRFAIRWHRWLTWLALLALGLALLAPVVSQTQRLLVEAPSVPGEAMAHHEMAHAEASSRHDTLAACDYCAFFLHMPGLLPRVPQVSFTPAAKRSTLSLPSASAKVAERYPRYIGRAPPVHHA